MSMDRKIPKVVIIGAGPGGLASAMILARAGLEVTVLERKNTVGGRTGTYREQDFTFDIGPTFFLYPRVLEEIFAACGLQLQREIPMQRLDPQYRLIFGAGGSIEATSDVVKMKKAIAALSPDDAENLERYLEDNRRKLKAFKPILEAPFDSALDLLHLHTIAALPKLRPHLSIWDDLARHFKDERVRLAFTFQAKYLGMSPYRCPSLFSILSYMEYAYGVWHPLGGCGAVSTAMSVLAQRMGVRIKLEEEVIHIEFEGKKATKVHTGQNGYPCDALVINADFAEAMQRLVPDRLRGVWNDKALHKKRYSCSTYMLYLGLKDRYDDLAHHTIYFSHEYRKNLDEIERQHVLPQSPSFYVQNACVTDPTLAPQGKSTLYVLFPVTHRHPNVDWSIERVRFRERAYRALNDLGLKNIERRIAFEKIVTPQDWEQDFRIFKGATFNLAHNFGQMLHRRPRNRFKELDGVYLTGGGTHPGSGLPVIYESARISSRLLLQDLGLATDFLDHPQRHGITENSLQEGTLLADPSGI